jgi:hypothetical protein
VRVRLVDAADIFTGEGEIEAIVLEYTVPLESVSFGEIDRTDEGTALTATAKGNWK